MKYTLNPGSWAFEFEKLEGQEVEYIDLGIGNTVYFPRIKCVDASLVSDNFVRIKLENGVAIESRQLTVKTNAEPETKDIWDLTTEDIGQYLKVVIDGHTYEGKVSDFAEELTYALNAKTGKVECEGERNVFIGVQRQYSDTKVM